MLSTLRSATFVKIMMIIVAVAFIGLIVLARAHSDSASISGGISSSAAEASR